MSNVLSWPTVLIHRRRPKAAVDDFDDRFTGPSANWCSRPSRDSRQNGPIVDDLNDVPVSPDLPPPRQFFETALSDISTADWRSSHTLFLSNERPVPGYLPLTRSFVRSVMADNPFSTISCQSLETTTCFDSLTFVLMVFTPWRAPMSPDSCTSDF